MDAEYYRDLTRYQFEGRKLILAGAPLAAFTSAVTELRELGAADLFLIAAGVGSGDLPPEDEARWIVLDTRADSMIGSFRLMEAQLHNPSAEVVQALDEWDPEGTAVMLPNPFFYQDSIAGRPAYGWRRPAWLALEDKVVVDEIWDAAGVQRAPAAVIPVNGEVIRDAIAEHDRGAGVALAGDASEGFNGGAEYVRWIATDDDLGEVLRFFGLHCDRVRVMPFLEGIPCSIHGFVFPDTVISLRPCELMTLRRPGRQLKYCGAASYWDPLEFDRDYMRAAARRVGEELRRRVDYRGAFTVDGVMTESGFVPTELNTRAGAAIGTLLGGLPGFGIGAINRALIEQEQLDYRPDEFERMVVTSADDHRSGGGWTVVDRLADATESVVIDRSDGGLARSGDAENPYATLSFGPGEQGGFVRFTPNRAAIPVGPSAAPAVVEAFQFADDLWDVGLGDLTPAPSVR